MVKNTRLVSSEIAKADTGQMKSLSMDALAEQQAKYNRNNLNAQQTRAKTNAMKNEIGRHNKAMMDIGKKSFK